MPEATEDSLPSWFGFPLTIREDAGFELRELEVFLAERKIGTRRLFAGNYLDQPLINTRFPGLEVGMSDLPNTKIAAERTFWIGLWPGLTIQMLDYVIGSIHEFVQDH
jgi:CDP-6-deoxy-D-xylo-4-hexulose-3-dehydrase